MCPGHRVGVRTARRLVRVSLMNLLVETDTNASDVCGVRENAAQFFLFSLRSSWRPRSENKNDQASSTDVDDLWKCGLLSQRR